MPSEAKAHPLLVASRFSIGIILARHWGFSIVSPQLIGPLLVIQPIQFPPIQYVSPARLGALLGFRLDVIAPLTIGFLLEQVANALR